MLLYWWEHGNVVDRSITINQSYKCHTMKYITHREHWHYLQYFRICVWSPLESGSAKVFDSRRDLSSHVNVLLLYEQQLGRNISRNSHIHNVLFERPVSRFHSLTSENILCAVTSPATRMPFWSPILTLFNEILQYGETRKWPRGRYIRKSESQTETTIDILYTLHRSHSNPHKRKSNTSAINTKCIYWRPRTTHYTAATLRPDTYARTRPKHMHCTVWRYFPFDLADR